MDSPYINGFTDIHTHILPGADDGAKDMTEALKMVHMAWDYGTRTIFLTPHYRGKYKKNTPTWHRENLDLFRKMVQKELPGMRLYLGNEIHYQSDIPERLLDKKVLTMNDSSYVLLEFSHNVWRSQVVYAISDIMGCGFTPIIAHAERYDIFRADHSLSEEVLEMGALIQLNADSVLGKHGLQVKRYCHWLLKEEMAHFIASDAHDRAKRAPVLRECFLYVHKKYGAEYASRIFYHNAQKVIANARFG